MADNPESEKPEAEQAGQSQPRQAKKGVNDTDSEVHTFGGERVDGAVADITDGEYGLGSLFKKKDK